MEPSEQPAVSHSWEFAGWGTARRITDLGAPPRQVSRLDQPHKHVLGEWKATALCGNDISSSVLYVSALCAAQAGVLAPVVLLIVGGVLFLYRRVYAEVGSALPLNGGTYTVLLNTTSKRLAAGAACLTLLSYVATAVISAGEAMHYAHNIFAGLPVFTATIVVLGIFATLTLFGVSDSASVALGIFAIHVGTLTVLVVLGLLAVTRNPSLLATNWSLPSPRGFGHALFFGFAVAMLGISGFESSANFIEEQREGVFPKTLRNMWLTVLVFNPLVSLLSLALLPLAVVASAPADLLARMGNEAGGLWLAYVISFDAVLVLSGAVLTSYVGVTGLVRRMTLDRCLPQVLLRENDWRGTNHWIILGFFALCVSILFVTRGDIGTLAGVYSLSFLSVMALFAVGNMLLKRTRARLPRTERAGWRVVVTALFAVLVAIAGNVVLAPGNVGIFAVYALITATTVGLMFLRIDLLKLAMETSRAVVDRTMAAHTWVKDRVLSKIAEINALAVVYFSSGDDAATLNRAALYVQRNEETNRMIVVHVYDQDERTPAALAEQLQVIDRLYPTLRIDFLAVRGTFGPELIEQLSRHLRIPKNLMFIGTPGDEFPHSIDDLGGVRLIL